MNEKKKIFIFFAVIALMIIGVIGINYMTKKANEKTIEKFEKLIDSKTEQLIYIGSPTCSYCQQFSPVLKEITKTYDLKYEYLNVSEVSDGTLTKLLNKLGTDSSTPQVVIVKEGKVINNQQGYTDRDGFFEFLQDNGLISKDEKLEAVDANLNKIDYIKYNELINSKEDQVIVIAQTGCSYCESAKPALNAIAKENEIDINWLNITELSEEDQVNVTSSLDIFAEDFGTPLVIVVKNKKVLDSFSGYESQEQYEKFFKENNLIK